MESESVEILMKVERTFDITISLQEAEKIITVSDFYVTVWNHVQDKGSERCASQSLFYSLRQSFNQEFNFPIERVKTETPIEDIFPRINRRRAYMNFANKINVQFPALVLPKTWNLLLTAFGIATILGGLILSILLINFFNYSLWALLLPVMGVLFTLLVSKLLDPQRTVIKHKTMREFTQDILARNYGTLTQGKYVNRKEMEYVINHIISELGGLDLDEISPEKKIADELGID